MPIEPSKAESQLAEEVAKERGIGKSEACRERQKTR